MANNNEIGIITEVGDMGLGFQVLSEQDQNKLKESNFGKDKNSIENENK